MPCIPGNYEVYIRECDQNGNFGEPFFQDSNAIPWGGLRIGGGMEQPTHKTCELIGLLGYWIGRGITHGLIAYGCGACKENKPAEPKPV